MAAPDEQPSSSYLSKLSPWSRSPAAVPAKGKGGEPEPLLPRQQEPDHVVSHKHRLSLRQYPKDCPPVRPCWFHAVDVPKRRPSPAGETKEKDQKMEKPAAVPKKYAAFSINDSKAIEAAFQKIVDEEDAVQQTQAETQQRSDQKTDISLKEENDTGKIKVPVNEDYLFDVDVERRELGPAYWLGPVYDVRRGTWFYQDGSVQRPCDENLAAQLEEGYLKTRAWALPTAQAAEKAKAAQKTKPRSLSQPRARPTSWTPGQDIKSSNPLTPQVSSGDLRQRAVEQAESPLPINTNTDTGTEQPQNTYRLFGAHMSSVVTYQDATTAWLLTDDFMSRMNYSMYQRFAGGGHFAGMKMTRGWINPNSKVEPKSDGVTDDKQSKSKGEDPQTKPVEVEDASKEQPLRQSTSKTRRQTLQRQMSSLLEHPMMDDPVKQDEEQRRRDEREIEDDYREVEGDEQGREIEHLILATHGVGQRLGLRLESVNFVHDANNLRKTLKAVYAESPDLRALNAELGDVEYVNSRVQVLPICWRHLLDFPKQSLKHNRKEHDLADTENDDEDFPTLDDITVEGVPAVRNLITDLALDILLYQSPAYKDHISRIVLSECNRIYRLFLDRNPNFHGKVSLVGHSLGSAIMFDILCRQQESESTNNAWRKDQQDMKLDFEVEDFYALGSPIGLFQMLKGKTIAARESVATRKRAGTTSMDDPMLDSPPSQSRRATNVMGGQFSMDEAGFAISRPKCAQIFNIFHPTDPIAYRIEPLISPAMAILKPQPLPYTKRGIFGAPMTQGFQGIGARVSQSVSSMWSSVASSLLTRGLGYSGDEAGRLPPSHAASKTNVPLSMGAGTNVAVGGIPVAPMPPASSEITKLADGREKVVAGEKGLRPATLIDAELETLYGGFQKRRQSAQSDAELRDLGAAAMTGNTEWAEAEERAKKLRREEDKVRRLNYNGRVDFAIQESVFDINLISAIASHLSYWSDEDVGHFIISQLLSRHRVVRPRAPSGAKPQE
nr:putative phospholipase, mitochondrial [Quercus suber]